MDSLLVLLQETGNIAFLHMQLNHALAPELSAPARLGVEMILPFAAHQDFSGLRDLEPFEVCFDAFHVCTHTNIQMLRTIQIIRTLYEHTNPFRIFCMSFV